MMQQTNRHQFNLVEPGDTFSPVPLNENMEKLDAVLGIGGGAGRVASGTYTGTGANGKDNPSTISVDFKPLLVFVSATNGGGRYVTLIRGITKTDTHHGYEFIVSWEENAVSWYSLDNSVIQFNANGSTYYWVAIGESL